MKPSQTVDSHSTLTILPHLGQSQMKDFGETRMGTYELSNI